MRVLSFDISSSTIGYGVLEKNKKIKLIDSGYFKPLKDECSIFKSLSEVRKEVAKLLDKYSPDVVAIEDITKFMPKKSSANTIIILAVYNRFIGQYCYEYMEKEPVLLPVITIRNTIKISNKIPEKEEIPSVLEKRLKIKWKYELNRNENIRSENYDRADGIAVGLAYLMRLDN